MSFGINSRANIFFFLFFFSFFISFSVINVSSLSVSSIYIFIVLINYTFYSIVKIYSARFTTVTNEIGAQIFTQVRKKKIHNTKYTLENINNKNFYHSINSTLRGFNPIFLQGRNRNRSTWNHLNPSSNRAWTRVAWLIERCPFPRILHCNGGKRLSSKSAPFTFFGMTSAGQAEFLFFSPRNPPCASFSPPFHFLLVPTPRSLLAKDPGERRIERKRDVARAR